MNDEPFDPIPGQKAAIEQLAMEAPNLAAAMWTLHDAFVAQGFTQEQGLTLVLAVFGGMIGGGE